MENNLNNEYIEKAIDELIDFLGVKENIDYEILAPMIECGKIKESVLIISRQLGLPIDISIVYVSDNYKAQSGENQFHSTQITKVDHSGKGIDGITAQVVIPGYLPLYGSSALINFPITIKVSRSCMTHPVAFATIMVHELSHVLLYSLQYSQKENEIYTDLTAMITGFNDLFKKGRKTSTSREEFGFISSTIHTTTTTYGYLTDEQFLFAFDKINSILNEIVVLKNRLIMTVGGYSKLLKKYDGKYATFKKYFKYISKNYNRGITKADDQRIATFFQPGYFYDFDIFFEKGMVRENQVTKFVKDLRHFTKNNVQLIDSYNNEIKMATSDLISKINIIKQNIKVLRKYIPYSVWFKNLLGNFSLSAFKLSLKNSTTSVKKLLNPFKVYILFSIVIILIFSNFHYFQEDSNRQPANNYDLPVSPTSQHPPVGLALTLEPRRNPISLNNGAILAKNSTFFKGLGKLDIDNGTDLDAVAKLVNILNKESVFTVYVKANSTYTISNIRDGVYKLVFNLGQDWDSENKKFLLNNGYSIFEEDFDFVTTRYSDDEYEHTRYSTFSVTLNPVVDGTARTNDIDSDEFYNY